MRNALRQKLTYTGFVVMLFAAFSVWAQPNDEDSGNAKWHGDKIIQELNLTPQQQEQINKLRAENGGQAKALRENMRAKRQELKAELDKQTVDEAKVKGIAGELKQLDGQMIDQRISKILELKKVLTPEQYQVFQEKMKNNMKNHMQKRKGNNF